MKIGMWISGTLLLALTFSVMAMDQQAGANPLGSKPQETDEISFKRDVRPILHDYCVSCHSHGERGYLKSGLDLTSYQGVMKGTVYGKVVIPGNSEDSTFTKLLTGTNKGLKMPMGLNGSGTLERKYILTLRKWVKQGAKDN